MQAVAIKQSTDLKTLTLYVLMGNLQTYEMELDGYRSNQKSKSSSGDYKHKLKESNATNVGVMNKFSLSVKIPKERNLIPSRGTMLKIQMKESRSNKIATL